MLVNDLNVIEYIRLGKDSEVINYFYKKLFPMVKRNLRKKGAKNEDIEDVFQESMVVAYEFLMANRLDTNINIQGLIYRISINKWLNSLRKTGRMNATDFSEDIEHHLIQVEESGGGELIERNLLTTLFTPIGEDCVEALSYVIYQDLMIEDVMHRMGYGSIGSTKMKIKRCKDKLYEQVEKNPAILDKILEYGA
jgi:DNA-directed RNA polymerase specialized sigma24 family protein